MCGEVFVTEEKSLISFAIISTEWHEEKKDYLDMFIPFCLQCLEEQRSSKAVVSIKKLKSSLTEKFGIKLPSNVVEMIVRRLATQGYIRIEKNVCYLTDKKIDTKSFEEKSLVAETHQRELFLRIRDFLKEQYPSFEFDKEVLSDMVDCVTTSPTTPLLLNSSLMIQTSILFLGGIEVCGSFS